MVVAVFGASPVKAAAYGTSFTTSITYQNVGADTATVSLEFYAEANGTPIIIPRPDLASMASSSVYVGALDVPSGFKGSAVMVSNQPLITTLVQVPASRSNIWVRPLSNGFSGGSDYVLIPTALRDEFGYNSIIQIQNVDSIAADIHVVFVPVSGDNIEFDIDALPPYSVQIFDLAQMVEFSPKFNGSVQIFAYKTGTDEPGSVIASTLELSVRSNGARAVEATDEPATTIYMPSALCKLRGVHSSAYAVQNTSEANVEVSVTYSDGSVDGPVTIEPGAKHSFNTCDVTDPGFLGSAIINASGNIVALGKVDFGGMSTAFMGFTSGSSKIGLPYVRWTVAHYWDSLRQRAYIAIQNVGADLPAGAVTVKYYDKNGILVGTDTLGEIPSGGKVNSNASVIGPAGEEFGYYEDGSFGGSAIVEGPEGSQLAVIVRIQTRVGALEYAEDYSGIPIQ